MLKRVTGTEFDGSCVTMTIGTMVVPVISAAYGDGQEVVLVLRATAARLLFLSKKYNAPAVFTYQHPEVGSDSDMLLGFKVYSAQTAFSTTPDTLSVTVRATCERVLWTSKRICLSRPNDPPGPAVQDFDAALKETIAEAMGKRPED